MWGTTLAVLCRLAYWRAEVLPRARVLLSLPRRAAPRERRNPVAAPKGLFGVFFLPLPVCDGCLEDKFRPQRERGTGAEVLGRRALEAMQGFLGKGGFPLHGAATVWSAAVVTGSRVLF